MFSLLLRRSHLYAALFLVPWVLTYAVSTIAMNHKAHFGGAPGEIRFEPVSEQVYQGSVPAGASPERVAGQLLGDLHMEGQYQVRFDPVPGAYIIRRESPAGLRRITYEPATRKLTVEEATYGVRDFLGKIHRRRGYESDYLKDDLYGLVVDAFLVTMMFWIFSGVWMWWQLRRTRTPGWWAIASGVVGFLGFLFVI